MPPPLPGAGKENFSLFGRATRGHFVWSRDVYFAPPPWLSGFCALAPKPEIKKAAAL
jgi:hypothetical protein